MFLSVLAVWMLQNKRWGMLWAVILTAVSLGLYQAYIPLTIGLYVLLLIQQALTGSSPWKIIKRGLYYCAELIGGVLLYLILLKIFLALFHSQLSDYQGVNSMGKVSFVQLPGLIYKAFYLFCMMPVKDYCGLASMKLIKIAYLLLGGTTALSVGYLLAFRLRKFGTGMMTALLCLMFPIAVNFIIVMCPDGWVYTIMLYPMALTAVVPLVIAEVFPVEDGKPGRIASAAAAALIGVLCFCYSYQANVNYTAIYYATRQTENYLNSIVIQVRMTPGFDPEKKWALIGDIDDPLLNCFWRYEITCGGMDSIRGLINRQTRGNWIQNYFGYLIPTASEEQVAELCTSEEVQAMPVWPSAGSIQAIGDTMVIKFQEVTP